MVSAKVLSLWEIKDSYPSPPPIVAVTLINGRISWKFSGKVRTFRSLRLSLLRNPDKRPIPDRSDTHGHTPSTKRGFPVAFREIFLSMSFINGLSEESSPVPSTRRYPFKSRSPYIFVRHHRKEPFFIGKISCVWHYRMRP